MFDRILKLDHHNKESSFLWGPRQTGKSTLLKFLFPDAPLYDLLLPSEFSRLNRNPEVLKEEILSRGPGRLPSHPVIVDEIQKIPALLDLVQWLIVNHQIRFILCGSSARKLKRGGGNLLGGRAIRHELFPLVSQEIPAFDLHRALNSGLLPRHYLSQDPKPLLEAYVGEYLKEEIAAEGLVRNLPSFSQFLEKAAFSNGEIVNYQNIARECGVSPPTAKDYFQILEDTLIARFLPSYRKKPKRRVVQSPKFYYFDVGVVNFLLKRGDVSLGTETFGRAFEHLIYQELCAHRHYSGRKYPLSYWRTTSQFEVDFILGEAEIAIEVKGVEETRPHHLKSLHAFKEEYPVKRRMIVSLEKKPRRVDTIEILPWKVFLSQLWSGEIL